MSGPERLTQAFERARDAGSRALVAYLCAGDPDPAETVGLCDAVIAGGADVLELGIPFSDPTADGPVIQRASERALGAGTRLDDVLAACAKVTRRYPDVPIVLFGYWNPWHRRGAERAAALAADAGAAGLLVVDLPVEESATLDAACAGRGLARVFLVAPTTGPDRLARMAPHATGFVYLVSRKGVTGGALSGGGDLGGRTEAVRAATGLPVAVGFGVSDAARARAVARVADGVVVGSALVARIAAADGAAARREAARAFTAELKRSLSE